MARTPSSAKAFAGRWRIVHMDLWAKDDLDLLGEAFIAFTGASAGEISFMAVNGGLDVRYRVLDGAPFAEFSWQGFDENDEASGRGWARVDGEGRLVGQILFHLGDDSAFVAERGRRRPSGEPP
jgi:hypothetical protein